jgi:arylsulfatase A-like enzyme
MISTLGLLLACGARPLEGTPDIVLVTIDTLRVDHVSAYGYARETTPFLDSLAAGGVRFSNAYSTASWTAPAVTSLLTGLHPVSHGITLGHRSRGAIFQQPKLSEELVMWPERLKALGYRTIGVTTNPHLTAELGFDRGFDVYRNLDAADAVALADVAREVVDLSGEQPTFLWLHLLDPHAPYTPHTPGADQWDPRATELIRSMPPTGNARDYHHELGVERGDPRLGAIVATYDSEIRYADETLRQLFADLEIGGDALVIATSDHGEAFLDHGGFGHGHTLHQELIRVPLIVRLPDGRRAGEVEDAPVSLADLMPTVHALLGQEVPQGLLGRSLGLKLEGTEEGDDRAIFASLQPADDAHIDAVVHRGWKLMDSEQHVPFRKLYNLAVDPTEQDNLIEKEPERLDALRAELAPALEAARAAAVTPGEHRMTTEEVRKLHVLGYLENPPPPPPPDKQGG